VISFLFLFTWWQFCIVQILSSPKTFLHISSVFFRSLIGNFLSFVFLLSPTLWLGIFSFRFLPILWSGTFFSLFSSEGKVYGKLGFWLKALGKRGCPTLYPWYTCNNDDLEILCKTSHACTHVDTQVSNFYDRVMLGLMVHFLYLSQPNASKTCSFINLCIHPCPFWVFGKIFTAFTLQVYTHFFRKWLWSLKICKEKLEIISFLKHVVFFLARQLIIHFSFFLSFSFSSFPLFFFFFLSYYHLFISSLFFLFFSLKRSCGRGRTLPTYV